MKKLGFIAFFLTAIAFNVGAKETPLLLKEQMLSTFDSIENVFKIRYAPTEWKFRFANWQLSAEAEKVRNKINGQDLSIKEYHRLLGDFFNSTKDYHVGFTFFATESSSLGFSVKSIPTETAERKYILVWVDRKKLPLETFPFVIGDELIKMNQQPIAKVAAELSTQVSNGNATLTDLGILDNAITNRRAARAMEVPRGPVTLTFVNKERVASTRQIIWDYVKEEFNHQMKSQKNSQVESALAKILNRFDMKSDLMTADSSTENPFMVGGRKSFIPALGKMLWQSADDNSFHAYTYLNDEGKVIGFLRISSYSKTFKDSAAFKEIIKHFKETTDALIIDQVNNPGGSVFYLYSLVSMLNDTAVATPKHRMAITASDVKELMTLLSETKDIDSDEKAKIYVKPEYAGGYYIDLNFVKFMRDYAKFIIDQFHSGNRLTVPYHLWGVDMINPHPEVSYQKPILLLINELDFSGGDFFPAIMQDAKRVTILGTRTAGAGGYVQSYNIDNLVGLESFRLTGSLAERVDSNPIENLGVKPDVEYQLTEADYKGNFVPYVKKIKETLRGMLTK